MRILRGSAGVGVRRGAHTCLVGKQASCDTVADSFPDRDAGRAAKNGLRGKGSHENHFQRARKSRDIHANQHQASHDIDSRHDRHHLLHHCRQALGSAHKNEHGKDCQQNSDGHRGDIDIPRRKHLCKGGSDGIGLYHISHKAQSQNDKDSKDHSQNSAKGSLKGLADIIHRAACHLALHRRLIFLGQHRLPVDGRHTEKGAEPHPENGARAAGHQRRSGARQVARAHLGRDGCRQGLKGRHLAVLPLLAVHPEMPEHQAQALSKFSYLNKFQTDREIDSRPAQDDQEAYAPHPVVYRCYHIQQHSFSLFSYIHMLSAPGMRDWLSVQKAHSGTKIKSRYHISSSKE